MQQLDDDINELVRLLKAFESADRAVMRGRAVAVGATAVALRADAAWRNASAEERDRFARRSHFARWCVREGVLKP